MLEHRPPSLIFTMLLSSCAAAMGWGIRGQYGHETGAMMPGLLVVLVLSLMYVRNATSLFAARGIAWFTLAIGVGGSMTYGQTVGLTHNPNMVGDVPALWWGMVGLAIKGGVWIGLGGAFLGMAWGGKRYSALELAFLLLSLFFVYFLGLQVLNEPYRPAERILPSIYFSASWYWDPTAENLEPRRERWGGLWFLLVALMAYTRVGKSDRLCWRLAAWGCLAGGLGFPLGQCLQAFHAWNKELFQNEAFWLHGLHGLNWWNMMETFFGAVWGAVLGLGVWLHRDLISYPEEETVELMPGGETVLLLIHVIALLAWNFGNNASLDAFADSGYTMILLPVLAVSVGRYWPYWMALPITLLPIALKTGRAVVPSVHEQLGRLLSWGDPTATATAAAAAEVPAATWGHWLHWLLLVTVPVFCVAGMSQWSARRAYDQTARELCRWHVIVLTWLYYLLNHSFFGHPHPWNSPWSGRLPNDAIFFLCAVVITIGAWHYGFRELDWEEVEA